MSIVLLIPSPAFADALLAPGRCGARVPTDTWWVCVHHHGEQRLRSEGSCCSRIRRKTALVLADAQGPLAEGMNRAREVLARIEGGPSADYGGVRFHECLGLGWILSFGHNERTYSRDGRHGTIRVDPLADAPRGDVPLRDVFALATILAHRGAGEVVVLDSTAKEVDNG